MRDELANPIIQIPLDGSEDKWISHAYGLITIYVTYHGSSTGKEVLVLLVVKASLRVKGAKIGMID
jgi:hypothetical protein